MTSLYKYLEEKYAVGMLERGNIRLGSLYEYRTHWNDQIRDEEEGTFRAVQKTGEHSIERDGPIDGPIADFFAGMGIRLAPGSKLINVNIEQRNEIPDRNIYCTTATASEAVMKQFGSDACIEIHNISGFFEAISEALKKQGLSNGLISFGNCMYEGRNIPYNTPFTEVYPTDYYLNTPQGQLDQARGLKQFYPVGYWLKAPFYKPQAEYRAVVIPADEQKEISQIIIDIPEIIPFIRRHSF